jgi:isopropylmalate/homocitrate/citramalate synthase
MTQRVEPEARDPHAGLIYDWNEHEQIRPSKPITLDDETLRDGLQSPSVCSPLIDDKIKLLHLMDELGIETADIGLPGAGPHVVEHTTRLAEEIARSKLKIRANCAARTSLADVQPVIDISQKTGVPIDCATFLGSSPIRRYTEDWELDRLLRLTEESVSYVVKHGLTSWYVTEDTTRADPETLGPLFRCAIRSGSRRLVICDTVGHATPAGVRSLIKFVRGIITESGEDVKIDWHGHNDRGLALTNALTAIVAGADQVHGCGLGIGERCGNTAMDQLLVNLKLLGWREGSLRKLPEYCRAVAGACRVPIPPNYPVIGTDAFETGTGVHAAAVIKAYRKGDTWLANRVYSGVPADEFGLEQRIRVGPMSGKSNVVWALEKLKIAVTDEKVNRVFQAAKRSRRNLTDDEIRHVAEDVQFIDEFQHFEAV